MPKTQNKHDHLKYAALHQSETAYIKTVKIHNLTSITQTILIGVIIYFSKSEFIPVILALIQSIN